MSKHPFTWYVNDDWKDEPDEIVNELVRLGGLDRAVAERLVPERPFYEVTLQCEVDDETLEVTILSASVTEDK